MILPESTAESKFWSAKVIDESVTVTLSIYKLLVDIPASEADEGLLPVAAMYSVYDVFAEPASASTSENFARVV